MATKKLSESQAWMKLAKAWDKPAFDGTYAYLADEHEPVGLCPCIEQFEQDKVITIATRDAMFARMKQHRPANSRYFWGCWWPTNLAGAKARAAFARSMAALAKKKVSR